MQQRDDIAGMDGSIITHPVVWKASGDQRRYRADLAKLDPALASAIGAAPDRLLEDGLRLNSGCRRGAGYACAVWFASLREKTR